MRDDLFPIDHNDYDNATRWAIRCLTHHCDPKGLAQVAVMATALLLQDDRHHTRHGEGLEAANAALKEENEKLKAVLEGKSFQVPEGWALVPREMTDEQHNVLFDECHITHSDQTNWAIMLSNAPKYEE